MLYSTDNTLLAEPMLFFLLYHIGYGENWCRLWISTLVFLINVKNDLLLTMMVLTSAQNRYWMSFRTDVDDLFSNSVSWYILLFSCNSHSYVKIGVWFMRTCGGKSLMMFRWTMWEFMIGENDMNDELNKMWTN